jgi:hypothetical protein
MTSLPASIVGTTGTARHVGTGTAAGEAPALARPMTGLPGLGTLPASIIGTTGGTMTALPVVSFPPSMVGTTGTAAGRPRRLPGR